MGLPAPLGVPAAGTPVTGDQANAVLSGTITGVGPTAPFAFRGPFDLAIWVAAASHLTTTIGSTAATVASATAIAPGVAINSVNVPPGTTVASNVSTALVLAFPPITLWGSISTSSANVTGLPITSALLGATVVSSYFPSGTTVIGVNPAAIPATPSAQPYGWPGSPGTITLSNEPTSAPATSNTPVPLLFQPTGNAVQVTGTDNNATYTGSAITFDGTIQLERSFDGGKTWVVCNSDLKGTLAQWTGTTVGPVSAVFGEPEKSVLYRLNCTVYTSTIASGVLNFRISQTGGAAESLAIGPFYNG